MNLSTAKRFVKRSLVTTIVTVFGLSFPSCDSMIFDDQGDCSVHYRLRFKYVKNLLKADAFASQITNINIAFYDQQGNLVLIKNDNRQLSEDNDYYLEIDITPGIYDIIAWCGGPAISEDPISFSLEGQDDGASIFSSGAALTLLTNSNGDDYIDKDIHSLYYGKLEDVTFSEEDFGVIDIEPISLIKDTNHITILLQNINDKSIDPSVVSFSIEARNSELNWENQVSSDTPFNYIPWDKVSTYTNVSQESRSILEFETRAETATGIKAEFTTGRLLYNEEQHLIVRVADSEILNIPIIQYFLLVRNNYQQMSSAQDYLDCYDDFTLTFFIDEGYEWMKSRVLINGWRVVPPQSGTIQGSDKE